MCTLVLLRRFGHRWPLLLAANRDELRDRPWRPPARHWPDRPGVVAGLDCPGGGTWLGLNEQGVVAAVTNRRGTLGPEPGRRSRGDLVLRALESASAAQAAESMFRLDPGDYRPFNLVIADSTAAFWLHHRSEAGECIGREPVPPGLSMLTASDLDDPASPRIRRHLPRFRAVPPPDPEVPGGWEEWKALLADPAFDPGDGPRGAMQIAGGGFGTLSSSLVALPAKNGLAPQWWFNPEPGEASGWRRVALQSAGDTALWRHDKKS